MCVCVTRQETLRNPYAALLNSNRSRTSRGQITAEMVSEARRN